MIHFKMIPKSIAPMKNAGGCAVDLSAARGHPGTMSAVAEKKSRLVARIPSGARKTRQAAADLAGASLNNFVVQATHRQAQEILERETNIRLNREHPGVGSSRWTNRRSRTRRCAPPKPSIGNPCLAFLW